MCSQELIVVTDSVLTYEELSSIKNISDKSNTSICIITLKKISNKETRYEGVADSVLWIDNSKFTINQIKAWLIDYIFVSNPLVVFFYTSRLCNLLASFIAAKLKTGIIVNCIDVEYKNGEFLYTRTAMNSSSIVKIKFNNNNTQIVTVLSFTSKKHNSFCCDKKRKTIFSNVNKEVLCSSNIFNNTMIYPDKNYSEEQFFNQNNIYIDVGYGAKDILEDIYHFANKINATIGTTKKMVDCGFIDEKYLIGQSGRIIDSRLCISIGTSGQLQHVVGIIQSKTIVAINSDPTAEIFKYCDFGIACRVEKIIGELNYMFSLMD